ncbi:MAG: HesA/MoeB/ThiF family protein [Rhodobacteraceae bacterium]|nr:HesA/MoeB/ThiF family protein [Paracoccaceae bacterium]
MGLIFGIALALWGLGALMKASSRARWGMIGALYAGVLAVHLLLPEGNALRMAIGGTRQGWLALGVLVALIVGYRLGLGALRRRATPEIQLAAPAGTFRPAELDRYARHIALREIGGPGQKRLKQASVLVIGAGGLGAPALMYLGAAGIGTLGVIDDDVVENSNLHRQVIHTDARIGMPKVFSAKEFLAAQNPFVDVRPYHRRLDEASARTLFAEYDLILDGSDNFPTRYLANRIAAELGKPLISAAITQWEGQISLFDPAHGTPCYECVFPRAPAPDLAPSCAEAGVVGALPGVMGAMMAMEAIKAIAQAGEGLRGRMLIHDALYAETRVITLTRRADCPVCGARG